MNDRETMEDYNEVVENIKESIDKEISENEEHDSGNKDTESFGDINNEWYNVKSTKKIEQVTDSYVQVKAYHLENQPNSSNVSEDDNHTTEGNNMWNKIDTNEKKIDPELENGKLMVKKAKKIPFQCICCQRSFLFTF